jgi:hypothetical protein
MNLVVNWQVTSGNVSQVLWLMTVGSVGGWRLKQETSKFKPSLNYIIVGGQPWLYINILSQKRKERNLTDI